MLHPNSENFGLVFFSVNHSFPHPAPSLPPMCSVFTIGYVLVTGDLESSLLQKAKDLLSTVIVPLPCLLPIAHIQSRWSRTLGKHQENDTLSDLSDLSCARHLRWNQTDLMDLAKATYLLVQGTNAWQKAVKTSKKVRHSRCARHCHLISVEQTFSRQF